MSTPSILLPNDAVSYDGARTATVVASQWGNDDPSDGPVWFVALLLRPTPPYFQVAELTWIEGRWHRTYVFGHEKNINDAVALYAEHGGDN